MTNEKHSFTARAHTNIALVKYWGKQNEDLIIPQNDSLSLTLDQFYTETTVTFDSQLSADVVVIDDEVAQETDYQRVVAFLDIIRQKTQAPDHYFQVISVNHVPTAAGFASSASAFAALAAAASRTAGLKLDLTELSRLARRGSGSASRSIFGGFVQWHTGQDDASSYAEQYASADDWDIGVIALTLQKARKKISSRKGMQLSVSTSPFYSEWVKLAQNDIEVVKRAIDRNDFTTLGKVSETNALRMHALTLSADPGFIYFTGQTIEMLNEIRQLRDNGIECYATIDAGPNVKVLCQKENANKIMSHFNQLLGSENVTYTTPGSGVEYL
ncbi:diphosphomevalonate decarboxylase [Lentilactobacillus senioris]|uniref:diphosphomevalonate decarboxylase n=1 Tax=Lentilactobacillus senioris TaxID=931534 RepID=UPI00227F001E|nr:diphosphomevalonate decarboxylase [Lentilactobacillus senioris]MCY9806842.1 diphosphomevalonate decarboxylase [Lentilactobacillus senioris]